MFLTLKGPRGNIILVGPNSPLVLLSNFQSFKIYLIRPIFFENPSPTIQHHLNLNISITQIWNSDNPPILINGFACFNFYSDINPNVSPSDQSSEKLSRFTTASLLKLWSIDKGTSNYGFSLCVVFWITRQLTKGNLGAEPITIKHFQYRNLNRKRRGFFFEKRKLIWIIHDRAFASRAIRLRALISHTTHAQLPLDSRPKDRRAADPATGARGARNCATLRLLLVALGHRAGLVASRQTFVCRCPLARC